MEVASFDRFELVGVRYTGYQLDEPLLQSLAKKDPEGRIQVTVRFDSRLPYISESQLDDRPVIEFVGRVSIFVKNEAEPKRVKKGKKATAEEQTESVAFQVECVAGFQAAQPADDGSLEAFAPYEAFFGRALYWMIRQRVSNLIQSTLLAGTYLPWDVERPIRPELTN